MCMIIDANRIGRFLSEPSDSDAKPIYDWLSRGGKIIYSTHGKFSTEIKGTARIKLGELARSGRVERIDDAEVEAQQEALPSGIRSDDPHVLALALASGARILYTGDQDLIKDFKDGTIIRDPRGKIYSGSKNTNLLTRDACAP